jgi:hypothetical protein
MDTPIAVISEPGRAPQRPVRDPLHGVREQHAHRHGDQQPRHHERRGRKAEPGREQRLDHRNRGERAHHHQLAVGEVDEPDDAVDHGVAERDQRIHAAQRDAVDQLLQQDIH